MSSGKTNNFDQEWCYSKIVQEEIAEKESTVKERLANLSKVIQYSYPNYQNYIQKAESQYNAPLCKMDLTRRCPLNKPHINRWKFNCVDIGTNGTVVWKLEASGDFGSTEHPSHVEQAIKVLEEFLQRLEIPLDDEIEKWEQVWVRSNTSNELMVCVTVENPYEIDIQDLTKLYDTGLGKDCNVKSLYLGVKTSQNPTSRYHYLYGSKCLKEVVNGISVELSPTTNFWSNVSGAENLGSVVMDYLDPSGRTTVLEMGCGIGLIGLILAHRCLKVIGYDSVNEIKEAEAIMRENHIENASYVTGEPKQVMEKISNVVDNTRVSAIVNTNSPVGQSIDVIEGLRDMHTLKTIVLITILEKTAIKPILELTKPRSSPRDDIGNPFFPVKACLVDTLPLGPYFQIVILFERRQMH